jgi:hypothetical protein
VTSALRAIYRYFAALIVLAIIVQIFLAGLGAFGVSGEAAEGSVTEEVVDDKFSPHGGLGFFIVVALLLLFLVSLGTNRGRNRILLTLALFLDGILQMILAGVGEDSAAVGGLHPVNALVLLGLTGYLAWSAWQEESAPRAVG